MHSPLSPNALYQPHVNISLASGTVGYYDDLAGTGAGASYNGAYGISFDVSGTVAFVASVDSKKLRKLALASRYVGDDITGARCMCHSAHVGWASE